jgi:hypothetical protein
MADTALDPVEAWKPWEPDAKHPFDLKAAGHLYRRAAFGGSLAELRQAVKQGPAATLDRLLDGEPESKSRFDFIEKTGLLIARRDNPQDLRGWWLYAMLHSNYPLREKLTLFWHDHFATSVNKVTSTQLMFQQNMTLRKHALGKFEPFLQAMSKDPAMLIWLDSNANVKGKPNENYARELMELFSLGVGNYTEKDIREAARAFTGWQTEEGGFNFEAGKHDDGEKTVLGKKGKWNGDDVVKICVEQPACALFIARKLYRFYVSDAETPTNTFLAPLADAFRKSGGDIKEMVRRILSSRHFFSEHAYRQRIKSPVELTVGAVWSLTNREVPQTALVPRQEDMGQALFAPPNVKGWPGGTAWLNTSTVLSRHNFARAISIGDLKAMPTRRRGRFDDFEAEREEALLREEEARLLAEEAKRAAEGKPAPMPPPPPPPANLDLVRLVREEKAATPEAAVGVLLDVLLQGDVSPEARAKLVTFLKQGDPKGEERDRRIREVAHMIMTMPEYQLN